MDPGPAMLELEGGLATQPVQDPRSHPGDGRFRLERGERRQGGDAAVDELPPLDLRGPGHDRQVVVGAPPVHAHRPPRADVAVVHGFGVGGGRAGRPGSEDPALEAGPGRAVVGRVVVVAIGMRGGIAGHDGQRLRGQALELVKPVRVDAHLDERGSLHAAGELRVGNVVAPRPERRRAVAAPDEEVRMAPPAAVEDRRLEDDVRAGSHRRERLGLGRPQLCRRLRVPEPHLRDGPAGRLQPRDLRPLVLVAALLAGAPAAGRSGTASRSRRARAPARG